MNTGFPRSALSDALPPVTVGPDIAGASGGAAANAVAASASPETAQVRARRRNMPGIYP